LAEGYRVLAEEHGAITVQLLAALISGKNRHETAQIEFFNNGAFSLRRSASKYPEIQRSER